MIEHGTEVTKVPRYGGWIQSYSNVQFWPMDAWSSEVRLIDIAHALSNTCRFGGHVSSFYSVAQHSVLVSSHCKLHPKEGLMHDATEAYLVDVPSPIKQYLSEYKFIETNLARVIGNRFGLVLDILPAEVHEHDLRALWTEKRDLKGRAPQCWGGPHRLPWREKIKPWSAGVAKAMFLQRAKELGIS